MIRRLGQRSGMTPEPTYPSQRSNAQLVKNSWIVVSELTLRTF